MMTATPLDAFRQEIEKAGLTPPATIIADGELHRFASNGDRADDAGWYIYFPDEIPAGVFGCWRNNIKQTWSGKADSTLTAAERERHRTRFDEARRQREPMNGFGMWTPHRGRKPSGTRPLQRQVSIHIYRRKVLVPTDCESSESIIETC